MFMKRNKYRDALTILERWMSFLLLAAMLVLSSAALAQDLTTMTGTVSSSGKNTLVVRSDDGKYQLFVFDKSTTKPASLASGTHIRVTSSQTEDPSIRLAVLVENAAPPEPGAAPAAGANAAPPDVVPASVRTAESAIEREAKLFHFGAQVGFGLDPEVIEFGVHARFGPFFSKNLNFRPSANFEWGEVTRMIGLNADVIYNLPFTLGSRRFIYFGGGPGFNFIEQSVNHQSVSFSDFHYSTSLNILLGVRFRNGVFTELKTGVYAAPAPIFNMMVGYTF
jgi:hypothetical protein